MAKTAQATTKIVDPTIAGVNVRRSGVLDPATSLLDDSAQRLASGGGGL
jgi:hypothetical protein